MINLKAYAIVGALAFAGGFGSGMKLSGLLAESAKVRDLHQQVQMLEDQVELHQSISKRHTQRLLSDTSTLTELERSNEILAQEIRVNGGDTVVFDGADADRVRELFKTD